MARLVHQAINSAMGASETEAKSIGSLRWYLCPTFDAGRGVPRFLRRGGRCFFDWKFGTGDILSGDFGPKELCWFVGLVIFYGFKAWYSSARTTVVRVVRLNLPSRRRKWHKGFELSMLWWWWWRPCFVSVDFCVSSIWLDHTLS